MTLENEPEQPTHYEQVLERLQELEGWAEYIVDALHINRRSEPVTKEMLKDAMGERELRQIRDLSWSLRDKLHVSRVQVELSRPLEKSVP